MTDKLTVAGLFAGIGGLDAGFAEGLEEQGFDVEHVALVEREPFPQRVLAAQVDSSAISTARLPRGAPVVLMVRAFFMASYPK